jgi:hypothetical protein
MTIDYEKLGAFYLGRLVDPATRRPTDELYLYDSKDLTTHAVCIGMTGSGKTGLCIALLEEAAIDGVPAIAIDPKGDIANLLLTFPNLAAEEFLPWVDPSEAARQGASVEDYAAATAKRWREGLAEWRQDPSRIQRLRDSAEFEVYTPGGGGGAPLSILRSLSAPPASMMQDADAVRQRISSDVAGLLALLGIAGDPLESREHILISTIVDRAWRSRRDVELPTLLREIQSPPFDKVGLLDLESFFPSTERFKLVARLNNLLASPAFGGWMEGAPLDVSKLLYTPQGKPKISILSIAHLSDSERMFFVTILLNEAIAWMRSRPGTSSLRAILYMDEIFGYFPPTANPPSKAPMLTLLKQARAHGLGIVLATQNPVDLDYKGMANTGTWFIGRLQTDRDKARVLDGLEGASTASGLTFDRATIDATISGLASRTFLVGNVHEDAPVLIQSRWALSYLRGPLTKEQLQRLAASRQADAGSPSPSAAFGAPTPGDVGAAADRPLTPPGVEEHFFAPASPSPAGRLVYRPALLGVGQAHFVSAKAGLDLWEDVFVVQAACEEVPHPVWEGAIIVRGRRLETTRSPAEGASFAPIPPELLASRSYAKWAAELKQFLYQRLALSLWICPAAKATSNGRESEGEFRVRVRQALHEKRDGEIERIRAKYAPKLARLEERIRKAEQKVEKQKSRRTQSTLQAALSLGGTLLGVLLGRKRTSVQNVQRAASSARAAGRVLDREGDAARARDDLAALQAELQALDRELTREIDRVRRDFSVEDLELSETSIRPRKADLVVSKVALSWIPWSVDELGVATPAFQFD